MSAKINFLRPLRGTATKTFKYYPPPADNWMLQRGYQAGKYFEGISEDVADIDHAFEILREYQNQPFFMIQGEFIPGTNLKKMIRRKRTDRAEQPATLRDRNLSLICFDVDGFKTTARVVDAIELFISELPAPFWEADYIYQFSASYGLTTDDLKCHLFFWLETSAPALDIREWIISYNKEKNWKNIIDPAVFVATQPIYTQRRICQGAPDPLKMILGLVKKSGALEWKPPARSTIPTRQISGRNEKSSEYSMSESIKQILTGASFHNEINKLALSLMGKGMVAADIKESIKGMMQAARDNISDPQRLRDWQVRFDDIDRSVDTAFDLVDNPAQSDLIAWLKAAPKDRILKEFPGKTFKKSPAELKEIIEVVATRTGIDKRELKKRVKGFKEKTQADESRGGRKKLRSDRQKEKIYEVIVDKHNYAAAADIVANILKKSDRQPPVFTTGGGLVYINYARLITIRQMAKKARLKKTGQKFCRNLSITPFRKPYHDLISRMGQDIRFINKPLGKEIDCPEKLASVVALGNSENNRELTGIVHAPFVQEDLTIFEKSGYDSSTGLFSMIDRPIKRPFQYPEDAYNYLRKEVLDEFPFKSELDAAVMISAMMALQQRPLLAQDPNGMPGFGITAPVQASGKTTLVNLATNAVLKTSVPVSSFSDDDEELKKHILAILLEGHNTILFDNIAQGTEIKSEELAKAMSAEVYSGRLLGMNRTVGVASSAIWFFTGNSILFSGDFATRVYPININPQMENPDTRHFKRHNLMDWVLEERQNILWALTSIIMNDENNETLKTGSRFKIWDKFIRNPIFHASGIDINAAITANKENDMDYINKKKLIQAMFKEFDGKEAASRELISNGFMPDTSTPANVMGELLEEILGKYSQNTRSVGRLLSKMVGRAYGDLVLTRLDKDRAYWQVEKIKTEDD